MTSLLLSLALSAVPTVTVSGPVLTPDATPVASGRVTCRLSQPGSVLDGAVSKRVAQETTATLVAGALSMVLVPNDVITPAGTYYTCAYSVTLGNSMRPTWTETWQLASAPNPVDLGAVPRLNVIAGVSVALQQASPTLVGGINLAGDLSGTAAAPQVVGPTHLSGALPAAVNSSASAVTATGTSTTKTLGDWAKSGPLDASATSVTASGSTTARSLADRAADVVNVKDYGAKGDGVTDDTAAIQAAMAAVASGQSLKFPAGVYTAGLAGLLLSNKTDVSIVGDHATIRATATPAQTMLGFGSTLLKVSHCTRCSVRGLKFDGNAQATNLIGLDTCTDTEVSDNELTAGGANALIVSGGGLRNRFMRNKAYSAIGSSRGMWLGNVSATEIESDVSVEGNSVYSNPASGIVIVSNGGRVALNVSTGNTGSGITLSGANGYRSHGLVVSGNVCRSNSFHGIQSDVGSGLASDFTYDIVVSGNVLESNAYSGIYAVNAANWTISGNVARDNSAVYGYAAGIDISRLQGGTVSGNYCYDTRSGVSRTQYNGISASAAVSAGDIVNVSVSGNVCYNNKSSGIQITTAGAGTIVGMSVTGNVTSGNGYTGLYQAEAVAGAVSRLAVSGNVSSGNATADLRLDSLDVAPVGNLYGTMNGTNGSGAWTFAAGDTTPSVKGRYLFVANNAAPTTISNFTNGAPGQVIRVWFYNGNTTIAQGSLQLVGAVNVTPTANSFMDFFFTGATWIESSRNIH